MSITNPGSAAAEIPEGYLAVFRLSFDDAVPTTTSRPTRRVQAPREGATGARPFFSDAHACDIRRFLAAHADAQEIVVHCEMGASRSVAVAIGLAEGFGWRGQALGLWTDHPNPNPHVHAIMRRVAAAQPWGSAP